VEGGAGGAGDSLTIGAILVKLSFEVRLAVPCSWRMVVSTFLFLRVEQPPHLKTFGTRAGTRFAFPRAREVVNVEPRALAMFFGRREGAGNSFLEEAIGRAASNLASSRSRHVSSSSLFPSSFFLLASFLICFSSCSRHICTR
jgi:hypothetical protein